MEEIERISVMLMGFINHSRIGPRYVFNRWSDRHIFGDIKLAIGSKRSGLDYRIPWGDIIKMLESDDEASRLLNYGKNR